MTAPTLARVRPDVAGAAIGLGIHLVMAVGVVALAVAGTDGAGSDRRMGVQLLVLAGLVLVTPILLVAGGVLALLRRTRFFGIGLLAGTAFGAALLVALCFLPL